MSALPVLNYSYLLIVFLDWNQIALEGCVLFILISLMSTKMLTANYYLMALINECRDRLRRMALSSFLIYENILAEK